MLAAYLAWSSSTSGVEQQFSKVKRSPVELASSAIDTDRGLAVVMGCCIESKAEEAALLQDARVIYSQLLRSRRARRRPERRLDAGCKKTEARRKTPEAAWHRRRRAHVQKAAEEGALKTPERRTQQELPESLQKEVSRQRQVEKKRKAEAYEDGCLLNKEVDAECVAAAEKRAKTQVHDDHQRHVQYRSYCDTMSMCSRVQTQAVALQGLPKAAWLQRNAASKPEWAAALRRRGGFAICEEDQP